eukprot:8441203-Alexandrium_andersonii.AAC.1
MGWTAAARPASMRSSSACSRRSFSSSSGYTVARARNTQKCILTSERRSRRAQNATPVPDPPARPTTDPPSHPLGPLGSST